MSVYKGTDGRWHGYVSMGLKDNGRRDRRHVSGERRSDVLAKVRDLEETRRLWRQRVELDEVVEMRCP